MRLLLCKGKARSRDVAKKEWDEKADDDKKVVNGEEPN
jgi:hypothetical protein